MTLFPLHLTFSLQYSLFFFTFFFDLRTQRHTFLNNNFCALHNNFPMAPAKSNWPTITVTIHRCHVDVMYTTMMKRICATIWMKMMTMKMMPIQQIYRSIWSPHNLPNRNFETKLNRWPIHRLAQVHHFVIVFVSSYQQTKTGYAEMITKSVCDEVHSYKM